MTFRSSDRARERALTALTRATANLAMPELDWRRIESNLLAGCEIAPGTPKAAPPLVSAVRWVPRAPTWSSSPWPMAVAAAAVAVLIYESPSGAIRTPVRPRVALAEVTEPSSRVPDLASLDVGKIVETGVHAAASDRSDVVALALAPNSRIEVVANDIEGERAGGITVALARGSIHADVKPRPFGEVFAIEVEHTRIAVHGTSFTVTRAGDQVIVEVSHGSVAVGPTGHRSSTHGWLVVGPDRAAFSLDGARKAAWLGAAPAVPMAALEPRAKAPSSASEAPTFHAKRLAVAPVIPPRVELLPAPIHGKGAAGSPTEPEVTAWGEGSTVDGSDPSGQEAVAVSTILRQLDACYEKQISAGGVRFTVASSLELVLLPSGAIREGVFTPPLSPTLMSCADKAIGAAHFPKGEAARRIQIPVQLSRPPR